MSGVKPFSVNAPQAAAATSSPVSKNSAEPKKNQFIQTTSSPRTVSAEQGGLMNQIMPRMEQILGYVLPRNMQPGYSSMMIGDKPQPKQKTGGIPLLIQGKSNDLSQLSGTGLSL